MTSPGKGLRERALHSKVSVPSQCSNCQTDFKVFPYETKRPYIYCSESCRSYHVLVVRKAIPNFGGKVGVPSHPNQKKATSLLAGENNSNWKGPKVKYRALHNWVERKLGKPHECELCGATSLRHRQYHWANLSGQYMRDIHDWARMCVQCHGSYDKELSAIREMAY